MSTSALPAERASNVIAPLLQAVLVDLAELGTQAKQLHWCVVGSGFRDLHEHLDQIVDDVRGFTDVVAERMRAVDAWPDARTGTVIDGATLSTMPGGAVPVAAAAVHADAALRAVVATVLRIHDEVERSDPSTADLLHTVVLGLEQHAWMLRAGRA